MIASDHSPKSLKSFRLALMLAALFVLSAVLFGIFLEGELQTAASDGLTILVDSLTVLALFYAARRSSVYGRQVHVAWAAFTLAQLVHTLGDIVWTYIELELHQPPFPSMADWIFLVQYPLFIAGILLLPTHPLTSSERLKVMLDEGIVIIASTMLFLVVLIAPAIEFNSREEILTQAAYVAFPVMDLMLLFALIELLFRRIKSQPMGPVILLVMGMAAVIITDIIIIDQTLKGNYDSGGIWDTGWIIGYSMISLAGILQAESSPRNASLSSAAPPVDPAYPSALPSEVLGKGEHEIHFAISDTGIGIPAEKMNCLFQSFSQVEPCTTRKYGGTGLGLAISKRLVELLGGAIWAQSEEGRGSTFHFTIKANEALSLSSAVKEPANGSAENISLNPTCGLRILLAEDNIINQKVMQKMLSKLGYRADVAANGLEVLAALDLKEYDVILMDIQMPEMDGLDAARKIRETRPIRPRIIAITAFAMKGDRERCIESGMNDYISKPVKLDELRVALLAS